MDETMSESMTMKDCADALTKWAKCELTSVDDCPTYDCAECPYDVAIDRVRDAAMIAAGVLRALAEPARMYTTEEIMSMPEGADIWIEEYPVNGCESEVYAGTVARFDTRTGMLHVGGGCLDIVNYNSDFMDGWRAWNKRPMREDCETLEWENAAMH